MTSPSFPSSVKELSPTLVNSWLAEQQVGARVADVRVVSASSPGDGLASTANRMALELEYEPGANAGLPNRMLLKTILLHRRLRFGLPAMRLTGSILHTLGALPFGTHLRPSAFAAIRAYQKRYPHAPYAMYLNEARFYRELRPELAIEAPRAFASVFDEDRRAFAVLMEDLTLRSARFPNATETITLEAITGLLATLAALHAEYWESPRLNSDLGWLATPVSGGMYPVFKALGLDLIRNQVETNAYKAELLRPLNCSVDELWEALWKAQAIIAAGPTTLLHGDPHIGNTYLLPDNRGGFLDWQLMIKGRWAHDFTYLLITGLDTEVRRKHQRELLQFYLDELRRYGVQEPPNLDKAWTLVRQAAIWGLVIGWLITPSENYGETITAANVSRLVAAVEDLETLRSLE